MKRIIYTCMICVFMFLIVISCTKREEIQKIDPAISEDKTVDKLVSIEDTLKSKEAELIRLRSEAEALLLSLKEREAQLVEINPLVLTPEGLVAVDGKMMLDDNAAFRQENIQELQKRKLSDLEKKAKQFGFSFVELDGIVGILANGAGLTMALLDVLAQHGLAGMNFLDVGGGADKDRVYEALKLIFTMNPKAVLINIYGGITRCDVVADAILHTLNEFPEAPPMVIRLTGTKEAEGVAILKDAGIDAFQDMMGAVEKLKGVVE